MTTTWPTQPVPPGIGTGGQTGDPGPVENGFAGWAYDPAMCAGGALALSAGQLLLIKVRPLVAKVTNIVVGVAAGGTLTAGQNFAGLYQQSTGQLVGQTADQSTPWASPGSKVMPLTAPISVIPNTDYRVALLFNGGGSPTFARASISSVPNAALVAGALRFATIGAGLTALPASLTLSGEASTAGCGWAGLS